MSSRLASRAKSQSKAAAEVAVEAPLPTFPHKDSVTIVDLPRPGFSYDNSVPAAFDTSMYPPCLRPLVNYNLDQSDNDYTQAGFDITPFTPAQVSFVFVELIENDLYCNVATNDWVAITARLNTVFSTQFNFRDVRHYSLRVVLQSYITWLTPGVNINNISTGLGLVAFYYHGVLAHSAIKEGAFEVLGASQLIFPDPVYELYMDTGFIPPTRRTVHGAIGSVAIHNPEELSSVFEPSKHANNPLWAQTNDPGLAQKYPALPQHLPTPFVPQLGGKFDNRAAFVPITQAPQQHISIHNTTVNPTAGLSAWGPVAKESIHIGQVQYLGKQVERIYTFDGELGQGPMMQDGSPSSSFGPTKKASAKSRPVATSHLPSRLDPYAHQSESSGALFQDVDVWQVGKKLPQLDSTTNQTFENWRMNATKITQVFSGGALQQSPAQTAIRNNFVVKNTFSVKWFKTHRDRYGDFCHYALPLIEQFDLYMRRAYPHYLKKVQNLPQMDIAQGSLANAGVDLSPKVHLTMEDHTPNPLYTTLRPFYGYKFGDHWSNDVDLIPDCLSQRKFNPHRSPDQIRITPTQSYADVISTLTQPVIGGQMRVGNPLKQPIIHPLVSTTSNLYLPNPSSTPFVHNIQYASGNETVSQVQSNLAAFSNGSDTDWQNKMAVWGYYDDAFYTNNAFPHQICPPLPPLSLFPPSTNGQNTPVDSSVLLHPEESRFYFILQQKLALYLVRRALRRAFIDLFYQSYEGVQIYNSNSLSRIVVKGTLSMINIQASLNPRVTARHLFLASINDPRIPPYFVDPLLKLSYQSQFKTAMGLNLTLISRLAQTHLLHTLASPNFIEGLKNLSVGFGGNIQNQIESTNSRTVAGQYRGQVEIPAPLTPLLSDLFLGPIDLAAGGNNRVILDAMRARLGSRIIDVNGGNLPPQNPPQQLGENQTNSRTELKLRAFIANLAMMNVSGETEMAKMYSSMAAQIVGTSQVNPYVQTRHGYYGGGGYYPGQVFVGNNYHYQQQQPQDANDGANYAGNNAQDDDSDDGEFQERRECNIM